MGVFAVNEGIILNSKHIGKIISPELKTSMAEFGYNTDKIKTGFDFIKEFIKTTPNFESVDDAVSPTLNKILKSKGAKVGYVAANVAFRIGVAALIGRGIGAICDKIKNNKAAKEADNAVE